MKNKISMGNIFGRKKATKKTAFRKAAGGVSTSLLSGRIGGARRKATQKRNSRVAAGRVGARVAGGRAQALAKRIKRARGR